MTHYVSGTIDSYDVEGKGASLADALRAYAADCRASASTYQGLVEKLLDEATVADSAASHIGERFADDTPDPPENEPDSR